MSSLSKDLVLRLIGDSKSAEAALKAAADAAEVSVSQYRRAQREADKQAAAARKAAQEQQDAMDKIGVAAMSMGAVVAAGLALSTKAAIDWESAWAGVQKVVDGTPAQMAELEGELRKLATTLPATHEEIAGVAEAAGQLGIARGDIVEFTETAIALGVSTNLSAEDAATGLARLGNIMGTSSSDVDRMGSTLVALGNAGASTEGDILAMGLRIAAAGRQAGMTEGEVLGMANAMSSLGIEAEAGGTAISTVMKKIHSAVLDGGDAVEGYARVAGVSAKEFAAAWREDAAGALTMFVGGLARAQEQGGNVNAMLGELELNDIRVSDTLLRLSGDLDGMTASLATGNQAWAENSALMNEANRRYETTASKLAMARNQINDAAIEIGGTLLPVLASGADVVADFARGFAELPGWMQDSVVVIGLLAATVGVLGGASIVAVPKIAAFRAEMALLQASSSATQRGMGALGMFMTGPWGAALGVATLALGGLITWLGNASAASEESKGRSQELAAALRETGGAIDDNIRAMRAQAAADKEVGKSNLLAVTEKLAGTGGLPKLTDALLGQRGAYDELVTAADAYLDRALVLAKGNTEDAGFQATLALVNDYKTALAEMSGETGVAIAENERLAAATEKSGGAADGATPEIEGAAGAMGLMADEGKDAATAAEDLADAIDALNGPTLNLRDAQRSYMEALVKANESVNEHGKTVDHLTESGRANQEALDGIAQAAIEQANAIYASTGSYDAFRGSMENGRDALIEVGKRMGMTEEDARALADQILQIPDAATVDVEIPTYQQVRQELQDVHNRVKGIPPQTWTNVGVLSAEAVRQLEDVGYRVVHLPDGTVTVTADTWQAEQDLNRVARARVAEIRAELAGVRTDYGTNYGGGRATGGATVAGKVYTVGERGPELVRFDRNAYVTPADVTASTMAALQQPTAQASPAIAAASAPVAGAGMAVQVQIDYGRLGAVIAAIADRRPTVGHITTQRDQTAYELAERLSLSATTRGVGD